MDTTRTDELKQALETELASLDKQLRDYGTEPGESIDVESDEGFADSAQATAERSSLLGMVGQLQATRKEVVDALARIEDGTYGYCEETGEPISIRRLEARPIATLSLEAQERHERNERVYRDD